LAQAFSAHPSRRPSTDGQVVILHTGVVFRFVHKQKMPIDRRAYRAELRTHRNVATSLDHMPPMWAVRRLQRAVRNRALRRRAVVKLQRCMRGFLKQLDLALRRRAVVKLQRCMRGFLQRLGGACLGKAALAARRAASSIATEQATAQYVRSRRNLPSTRAMLHGLGDHVPKAGNERGRVLDKLLAVEHYRQRLPGLETVKDFLVGLRNDVLGRCALDEDICLPPILLKGPPGSGKRLAAQLVHDELQALHVCDGPFVEVSDWDELKAAFVRADKSKPVSICIYICEMEENIDWTKTLRRTQKAVPTALLLFGLKDKETVQLIQRHFVQQEPVRLDLPPTTVEQLAEIARRSLEGRGYQFAGGLDTAMLMDVIKEKWSIAELERQNGHLANIMIQRAIHNRNQRQAVRFGVTANPSVLLPQDFGVTEASRLNLEKARSEVMQELESMPGFHVAKDFIRKVRRRVDYVEAGGNRNVLETCMNLVLTGNPGTGKTTFARLLFRLLRAHGVLKKDAFIEMNALELKGKYCGHTAPKVINAVRSARGGCLFIDEAYALCGPEGGRKDSFGDEAVHTLLTEIENHRTEVLVVIAGYKDKMGHLLAQDPGLARRFPLRLDLPDYTSEELALIVARAAHERFGLTLDEGLVPRLARLIEEEHRSEVAKQNASLAVCLVEQAVERMTGRLIDAGESPESCQRLLAADFGLHTSREEEAEKERQLLQRELEDLVGMREPKEYLRRLQKRAQFVRLGGSPKLLETCLNVVVTGNPGTGKTTFARLLFRFLRAHGVLKKDVFIERNALELKGEYCGQTAPKIREIFDMALGGCLFLDEAYALANGDKFSNEAIRMLLTEVENHRTEVLVVLAGYHDKMNELIDSDPGLARRFPHTVELPDYTAEELAAIAAHSAKHRFGTPFEEGVQEALGEWLGLNMARLQASKHNGGLAVQLTEEGLGRLAERAAAGIEARGIQAALQHESLRLGLCDFGVAPSGELRRCKLLGTGDQQHPQPFVCPVTLELLHDPVTTPYGHTYERSALFEHLQHWQSDPLTKQPLTIEQVFPNFALRQALEEYRGTLSKEAHGGA